MERTVEEQFQLPNPVETELQALVDRGPASILIIDADTKVVFANETAHQLLECQEAPLWGQDITPFFPFLAMILETANGVSSFRTKAECQGRRRGGEPFQADVWFATYNMSHGGERSGLRLGVIFVDNSEQLRDREEMNLQRLLTTSNILMSAVSHEVKNICVAISGITAKLRAEPQLQANRELQTLGSLVEGLKMISTGERAIMKRIASTDPLDLNQVLTDLRIVTEQSVRGTDASIEWQIPSDLPSVVIDYYGLMQVFLNLTQNAERAMREATTKRLTVSVVVEPTQVIVRFHNTGSAIAEPERLFQLFQPDAIGSGLGLYISRATLRAYAGELRHEVSPQGCCFAVCLARPAMAATVGQ